MAGVSQTAGDRRDHDEARRYPDERQLRLVPTDDPPPVVPAVTHEGVRVDDDGCNGSVVSLAAYVLGLAEGSQCFCCGEALVAADPPGAGGAGGVALICVACEAEVEREART